MDEVSVKSLVTNERTAGRGASMILRIALILGCLLSLAPLEARAGVQTTTVAGTVYRADGSVAAGTLIVSWPAFVTADGAAVAAGTMTVQIGTSGAMSAALAPNEGATPAGSYYTAVYHLNDGTVNKEYWLVPQVPNATLAAVRAKVVPAAVAVPMIGTGSVSSVYQLMSGNFLPLGGGTVSGDIIAKDGSPVASEAYVTQHASSGIAAASGTVGAVQINNGQGSLGTDSGLTMDTANHILNIPGQMTTGPEENAPRAVYDPMNPKYAGGLGNATTPAQQQAVLQATLDQAACDERDGKVSGATVIYPVGIRSGISELMVHSGITFECSVIGSEFGGSCQLYDSAPAPVTVTASSGQVMIRLDFTNHGMCHGVDTVFGGSNAAVIGFGFAGQDGAGGGEEGIRVYDIHDYVAHNSFNAFGGPAIEMSGAPGDGVAEWNYIENSPRYWIENPAAIPVSGIGVDNGDVAALACTGEDTTCNYNEVSTGSVQAHGGARQANYPHVAAMMVDGGSARINNNFVQVSDVGLILKCCAAGNQINGLRADIMAGSAIVAYGSGSVLTGVQINQPCEDPAWVDASSQVSGCNAIAEANPNTYTGVSFGPFGGFGPSYVGALLGSPGGVLNSYTSGYGLDAYGNGSTYSRPDGGSFYGVGAPAEAQQITSSCSFSGQTVIATNGCAHIQLTDTTRVNVQSLTGLGDGKTITIEGTANDTLMNAAGGYLLPAIVTCSGANVVLGDGPLLFFYTTRDAILHQICGTPAFDYTNPSFQATADAPPTSSTTYLSTVFNEGSPGALLSGAFPAIDTDTSNRPWTMESGGNWQYASGGGAIGAGGAAVTGVPGQDYTITGHIASSIGGANDILFRYIDAGNEVYIHATPTSLDIINVVGGGSNTIASTAGVANTGDFTISVTGSSISATVNGVTVSGTLPASTPTGTMVGLFDEVGGMKVTSFVVTGPGAPAIPGGTAASLSGTNATGTKLALVNNGHTFNIFAKDTGDIWGVSDGLTQLIEATPTEFGSSSAAVVTASGTPASSTPAGGCVAHSLWADDNYLYHCSGDGATVKRAALGSF